MAFGCGCREVVAKRRVSHEESPDAGPVPPDELQKSGLSPESAGIDVPRPSTQSQFHNALFSAGQSPLDGPVTGEQTEALGFAPAVFQRPLPGFLSSGGDDEDDASLIQVGLQGGRLGRGPFGPRWRADKPLYSHYRRSSICAQTLMTKPPGRWRCLAHRQLTRYNLPRSCRRSIKSGSATRSLSHSVGARPIPLLNTLSKVTFLALGHLGQGRTEKRYVSFRRYERFGILKR